MIPTLRRAFNESWTDAGYRDLVARLESRTSATLGFPISETPCFFPRELMDELSSTGVTLVRQILDNPGAMAAAEAAVPERFRGPNAGNHPVFLQVDFGLVRGESGRIEPKLVELQAFASLYGFQLTVAQAYRDAFHLSPDLGLFLGGLDTDSYHAVVGDAITGGHDPREVVLMEIEPRKQKTWPDFVVTEQKWGVRAIDTAEVEREGRRLFYRRDGKRTPIARVYNRVIPDELERKGVQLPFDYRDELDIEWAGHPAWYFKISKHSLPFLKTEHTSPAYFADELPAGDKIEDYALKPLYSFAGARNAAATVVLVILRAYSSSAAWSVSRVGAVPPGCRKYCARQNDFSARS